MSAAALIRQADEAGVALRLVDGKLKAVGQVAVVQSWAPRLREHKPELVEFLIETSRITSQLLTAAMRRCDQFNDSEKARQDMREQILETPPHLRQDLLDHFTGRPTGLR